MPLTTFLYSKSFSCFPSTPLQTLLFHSYIIKLCMPDLPESSSRTIYTVLWMCIFPTGSQKMLGHLHLQALVVLTTLLCMSVYSTPQYTYHLNNYIRSHFLDATVCNWLCFHAHHSTDLKKKKKKQSLTYMNPGITKYLPQKLSVYAN